MFAGMIAAALGAGGKKPVVPPAANVDVNAETAASYADIAKNLPALQDIAARINASNTEQLLKNWETMLPGIKGARKTAMANTAALLKGTLPPDVLANIERSSAAAARRSGTAGSTFGYNFTPASVGTTSLALEQQGLGNLESLGQMFKPSTFDYTGLFVTPQQRIQVQQWNEQNRYQQQMSKNAVAAMPTPFQNEFMKFSHSFDALTWKVAESAAGMGMGGIGGAAGASGGGGGGGGYGNIEGSTNSWNNYMSAYGMSYGK